MSYLQCLLNNTQESSLKNTTQVTIEELSPGILELKPNKILSKNKLVISCAIHGNETAPIEIIDQILTQILNEKLNLCCPLLLIFGNIPAMKLQKRFIDYNLNRLFNGAHKSFSKCLESKRASIIESKVSSFFKGNSTNIHLDLHTAIRGSFHKKFAVFPSHQDRRGLNTFEIDLLKAFDLDAVLLAHKENNTFASYTAQSFQATSFTIELGAVKPFGENSHDDFENAHIAVQELLTTGTFSKSNKQVLSYKVCDELIRDSENYKFHISDDYKNFYPLTENQPIHTDSKGQLLAKEGQCLVFPNAHVALNQRTALLLEKHIEI